MNSTSSKETIPLFLCLACLVIHLSACAKPVDDRPQASVLAPASQPVPSKDTVIRSHDWFIKLSYGARGAQPAPGSNDYTVPEPPKDVRNVDAVVQSVSLPFLDTPSLIGERAMVTFVVKKGDVPGYPKCVKIHLTFDSYVNPYSKGKHFTLQFLPNGSFWGIEENLP